MENLHDYVHPRSQGLFLQAKEKALETRLGYVPSCI